MEEMTITQRLIVADYIVMAIFAVGVIVFVLVQNNRRRNPDEELALYEQRQMSEVNNGRLYGFFAVAVTWNVGSIGLGRVITNKPWDTILALSWTASVLFFVIGSLGWALAEAKVWKSRKVPDGQ